VLDGGKEIGVKLADDIGCVFRTWLCGYE